MECNPDNGMCDVAKEDGTSCDTDDDDCTVETCQGGSCEQQSERQCDDGNPCTESGPGLCMADGGCPESNPPLEAGASCGEPMCNEDGDLVAAPTCDGQGTCQEPQVMDCGAYLCQSGEDTAASCPSSCESDAQCREGNFCFDRPDDSDGDQECYDNRPPEADAGPDLGGYSRDERVILDGTQSEDPDQGDSIAYKWELVGTECPNTDRPEEERSARLSELRATLTDQNWDPNVAQPRFQAPAPDCAEEILSFELVVNDGEFDSEPDEVEVQYGQCNQSPTAIYASAPDDAQWGETVTFDGSDSITGCGGQLEYSWSYEPEQPELTTTELEGGEQLEVTLPDVCRESEVEYDISLTVFDGLKNSEPRVEQLDVAPNGPCETDAGSPDAGTPVDAAQAPSDRDLSGSGCAVAGGNRGPAVPWALLGVVVVGAAYRRRR
jgi:MYXO-CTERM domain-containing protein